MCTNIDTVISLIIVYVIGFLCIALVGYRVGWWIGEQSAYKRFDRICNECRNKKNELVGKIDKFNYCILCNSSEKSNS